MDRVETLRAAALGAAACGLVLVLWGARLLARARAAARWTGPLRPAVGRRAAEFMIVLGLLAVAVAVPTLVDTTVTVSGAGVRPWVVRVTVGLVTLAIGGYAVTRLVDRAELTALIRTPHVPGQPGRAERRANYTLEDFGVQTDGQAGWVYRDRAGEWYLAVAVDPAGPDGGPPYGPGRAGSAGTASGRQRLIRLTDFTLMSTRAVSGPLDLAGSVEIRVIGTDTGGQDGSDVDDPAAADPAADDPAAADPPPTPPARFPAAVPSPQAVPFPAAVPSPRAVPFPAAVPSRPAVAPAEAMPSPPAGDLRPSPARPEPDNVGW